MSRAIVTAQSMPLTERRMRWEAMMRKLRAGTIQQWFADFVEALEDAHAARDRKPIIAHADAAPVWPLRAGAAGPAASWRIH
jgi:trehalose 6-phosphate synthase